MISDIAISSGLNNLWLRMPLAIWMALSILLVVDRRRGTSVSWIVLCTLCIAASFKNWAENPNNVPSIAINGWLASLVLAIVVCLLGLRRWLSNSAEMGREWLAATFLSCLGSLVVGTTVLQPLLYSANLAQAPRLLSLGHLWAMTTGLATALVCGIELTFLSSPHSLSSHSLREGTLPIVNWRLAAWCALQAMCVELVVGIYVFRFAVSDREFTADTVLVRLFVVALLVTCFVAWMIPHRVYTLQRKAMYRAGSVGKTSYNWASLAIAAWLAAVSLVVVCALPDDWPWRLM